MSHSPFGSNEPDKYGAELFAANPYAPTSETLGQPPATDEVESYRRTYLKHEASCQSIGTLYLLGAILFAPAGLLMVVGSIANGLDQGENAILLVIGVVYFVLGSVQGTVGIGLRRLREWARIGGIVFSTLGLLAIPIGTLISAYFLYLLLSDKGRIVFSPHYQDVIAQTPHIKYKTPLIAWVALLLIVALIILSVMFLAVG